MNQSASQRLRNDPVRPIHRSNSMFNPMELPPGATFDALFSLERLASVFQTPIDDDSSTLRRRVVSIEAMAEIEFMKGSYEKSLHCYLNLGAGLTSGPLSVIEYMAIASITNQTVENEATYDRYKHVLTMIETHNLHRAF
jgi:hypothetical protein